MKIILLDIEGTTTPIDFVTQILFPYARLHLENYLSAHWNESQSDIAQLQIEHKTDVQNGLQPPALDTTQIKSVVAYLYWLMDQDRKATPLKSLQGKIWEEGYKNGDLKSQIFPDVPEAFARWQQDQKRICIFSSGSVLAQKLLFTYTEAGNLSGFISGWFDTNIGAKCEATSYQNIAAELQSSPEEILFISDVTGELAAAQTAGMQTLLLVREGNPPQTDAGSFQSITSFVEIQNYQL